MERESNLVAKDANLTFSAYGWLQLTVARSSFCWGVSFSWVPLGDVF